MKSLKTFVCSALTISILGLCSFAFGADQKPADPKLKPYTLKNCIVSGDKLGEMGEPYVYKYQDREIKFCCKNCVKDFKKDPAKYVKKIQEAEAKAKK